MERLDSTQDDVSASVLQEQLRVSYARCNKLQGELDDAQQDNVSLQQSIEQLQQKIDKQIEIEGEIRVKSKNYKRQLKEKEAQIQELEIELQTLRQKTQEDSAQLDELSQQLMEQAQMIEANSQLEQEHEALKLELANVIEKCHGLERQIAELEDELEGQDLGGTVTTSIGAPRESRATIGSDDVFFSDRTSAPTAMDQPPATADMISLKLKIRELQSSNDMKDQQLAEAMEEREQLQQALTELETALANQPTKPMLDIDLEAVSAPSTGSKSQGYSKSRDEHVAVCY
jgi:chromosome segregation ATPase